MFVTVRSVFDNPLAFYMKENKKTAETIPRKISRVEINFINLDNKTVHTIQLQPSPERHQQRALDYSRVLPLI